jgi:hypothetical protein
MKSIFALILTCLFAIDAWSYFEEAPEKISEMNGISFQDFKDFTKKWRLITVRYREDSKEMRLTYANDIAWKEMQQMKPQYSDGAIFAKVGLVTEKDPAFPSSEVPAGAKRYQFMIRDTKKYASTRGWGYALFDAQGHLFNEDMKSRVRACSACHDIVPERGYVFSRPWNIDFGSKFPDINRPNFLGKFLRFETKRASEFKTSFTVHLQDKSKSVDSLEGEIKRTTFSGTLDEIVPVLIDNARAKGRASALYVDERNFSLVAPLMGPASCESPKARYKVIIYFNSGKVRDSVVCQ